MNKQELSQNFGAFFMFDEQQCKELEKLPVEMLSYMYNVLDKEFSY